MFSTYSTYTSTQQVKEERPQKSPSLVEKLLTWSFSHRPDVKKTPQK
jgi:hypothetical protein